MRKHHKDKKNQDFLATYVHSLHVNEFLKNLLFNVRVLPLSLSLGIYPLKQTLHFQVAGRLTEIQPPASVLSFLKADGVQMRQNGANVSTKCALSTCGRTWKLSTGW